MLLRALILLLISNLWYGVLLAQVEQLTTKDGLSHRWVLNVTQDRHGFIWISTFDGLNRYDGREFRVFRPSQDGVTPKAADRIREAVELAGGDFLVSTEIGLFVFDPLSETFERLTDQSFRNDILQISVPNKEEKIWWREGNGFESGSPIMAQWKEQNGVFTKVGTIKKRQSLNLQMARSTQNQIWFWALNGPYYRLDIATQEWQPFDTPNKDLETQTKPIDQQGRFWYPDLVHQQLRYFQLPANSSSEDWTGFQFQGQYIWLVKRGKSPGLYRFDIEKETFIQYVKTDAFTQSFTPGNSRRFNVFEDAHGLLWAGVFQGLLKIQPQREAFKKLLAQPFKIGATPPIGFSARNMVEDSLGNIFVLENLGKLYKLDPTSGNREKVIINPTFFGTNRKTSEPISYNKIIADQEGYFWICSFRGGLIRFNPYSGEATSYLLDQDIDSPSFIEQDKKGRFWGCAHKRYFGFDPETGKVTPLMRLPTPIPYISIDPDSSNLLWVFLDRGLLKINTADGTSEKIQLYAEARDQRCITWANGYIWLGTSEGLVRVDRNNFSIKNFSRAQGLPDNFVYSMVSDGGHLWLGTGNGLCRFDVSTEAATNYYLDDGLSHFEFNSESVLKTRDGQIYMGGLNGINVFSPDNLLQGDHKAPRLIWSKFSYFDAQRDSLIYRQFEQLNADQPLVIGPHVKNFTFYLAIDNYNDPQQNQFAWRVDEIDKDWTHTGNQSFFTYNQMPPGRYTFRAKAADPYGTWSENELKLSISVLRPWYSRWWAWLIYTLIAGLGIYVFYRFQLSRKLELAENRRLRELDAFKSRFFANITHEFRTPLTVILGMTSDQKKQTPENPADMHHTLQVIQRNGQHLLNLVNQILDLSKLEAGQMQLAPSPGDPIAFVQYCVQSLESMAMAKDVRLEMQTNDNQTVHATFDQLRLQQILTNLISNAIKFTHADGQVTIRLFSQKENQFFNLKLEVEDTGIGIEKAHLDKIFDRFYQTEHSQQVSGGGGSGIGLALVKELVHLMNGSIEVTSEVGKGTSFRLILPFPVSQKEAIDKPLPAPHPMAPVKMQEIQAAMPKELLADAPILLLIEDNPDVANYIENCVQDQYVVIKAPNGQKGLEKAIEHIPDVIISDVMMPEMDGYELCKFLKSDERTSHIPVILLTARADMDSKLQGLKQGADAYLTKPFHREELMIRLEKLIQLRHQLQARYRHEKNQMQSATPAVEKEDAFLQKIQEAVEQQLSDHQFGNEQLAQKMNMSETQLYRKLKALTGKSIAIYIRSIRLQHGKILLETTDLNVSEVAYEVGFTDPNYFSRTFSREFGLPPSQFRN